MVKITSVEKHSHAGRKGILPGDFLIKINGNNVRDVLDYRFYLAERSVELLLERDGSEFIITIKKGEYDDIGLDFETPLMDKKQTCKNGCIFCFIDQNPEGLRETLYFKDDDSRLSFLHGNYITLTNMTDEDVDRIVKMRFSPINISVHTTNPELRVKMMKNKRAGEVLSYLGRFRDAGLVMCAQIVLCRGINDGEELKKTLSDLSEYYPSMQSVAIVPAGLTKHRDGLYPLSDFSSSEADEIINIINGFGDEFKKKHGTRLVYCADEFYLKANRAVPDTDYYEDYSQIENGVGMLRSFSDEFEFAMQRLEEKAENTPVKTRVRKVSIATGVASYPTVLSMAERMMELAYHLDIRVYEIKNRFFGESITVSGLLTGRDISEQLSGKDLGEVLFIPQNALRFGEEVFLCGMSVSELSQKLNVRVCVSENDGYEFASAVLNETL